MCKEFRMSFLLLSIMCALLLHPQLTIAQLISVKSVPVAEGDQFTIFPSLNISMGGVSIALDDPLLDPFLNPAKRPPIWLKGRRTGTVPSSSWICS